MVTRHLTQLLAGLLFSLNIAADEIHDRVLVVYGSADLSPWIQMYNTALTQSVAAGDTTFLQLEFLEVAQYTDQEKLIYAEAIYEKLKKFPPDLVVGVLPNASDFVHRYGEILAPETPRLYVLPGRRLDKVLDQEGHTDVVHSYWDQASRETRSLVEQLFPETEQLYYVVGTALENRAYLERTQQAFSGFLDESSVEILSGYTPDEIIETFLAAPPNSVAVYVTFDHDRFGVRYTDVEIMKLIENDAVPIFGIQDTLMGAGVIGGSFTSASLYGAITAQKVKSALGQSSTPQSLKATGTLLAVDDQVMKRFGLDPEALPDTITHINHEVTIWQQYWQELLIALTIIALQTLFIILLYIESRRRKRMERDRENQSRLFESVINGISDAIVVTDKSGAIIATNSPGFELTFCQKPDTVIGKPLHALFGNDTRIDVAEPSIVSCVRGDRSFPGEMVVKPVLDVEGGEVGQFAVVRDVSERLAREEELRQAHKMEAVGNLAGGIAHDFNNILMAIVGNAELAVELNAAATPQVDLLQRILKAADRARDLVQQIMSFSRRDEGDQNEAVHLGNLLSEFSALMETSFSSSVITQTSVDDDLWLIHANPTQIQQIVLNLCSNANHAMNGEGTIHIKAENVTFETEQFLSASSIPAGRYVALKISDTGHGIDEVYLPHIFDPFFTTKDRGEGTGMGLAMVYRIAESHEAFIDLQTGPTGTCFSLFFPEMDVTEAEQAPDQPVLERLPEGMRPRVLLLDDDVMVLRATEGALRMMGCDVTAITDPNQAVDVYERHTDDFDLLLTDQVMPGLSGLQVIDKFMQIRPISAILSTGNAEVSELQDISGVELLRKPYTHAQLESLVAEVLQGGVDREPGQNATGEERTG